jgi:hypothetical protein
MTTLAPPASDCQCRQPVETDGQGFCLRCRRSAITGHQTMLPIPQAAACEELALEVVHRPGDGRLVMEVLADGFASRGGHIVMRPSHLEDREGWRRWRVLYANDNSEAMSGDDAATTSTTIVSAQ